jgi:putative toxin-antitoxin system antitoxin component (TIGR02293 family)
MPAVTTLSKKKSRKPVIPITDKWKMAAIAEKGISSFMFKNIQGADLLQDSEWASLLDISSKSLYRYKQSKQHFKPSISDKILQIAEVFTVGLDVFNSKEQFRLWLGTPNYALGSAKPIALLKTSYGKDLVLNELIRINYGIFS